MAFGGSTSSLGRWMQSCSGNGLRGAGCAARNFTIPSGQRICPRLWGIDAPESSQLCRGEDSLQYRCGAQAANDLDTFIARRPVNCSPLSLDPYGRTVATCSVGGTDLGEWLVREGLALDWPQYSKGRYGEAQHDAERAGRGIWKGSYVEPWLYRACIRANGKPQACSDDANAHP